MAGKAPAAAAKSNPYDTTADSLLLGSRGHDEEEYEGTWGGQTLESKTLSPSVTLVSRGTTPDFQGTGQLRRRTPSPAPSSIEVPIADNPQEESAYPRSPVLETERMPLPSTGIRRFWDRNKPSILVAVSQFFGALMNVNARFLELEGKGMHPIQVLFMRQIITTTCCTLYMWWVKTPDFPLGPKGVRWILLIRGSAGFFGIFGMWYSMMYLGLADATVITFLAPGVAGILCYFTMKEPFTRPEQLATFIALLGVVLIAQPTALFDKSSGPDEPVLGGPPEQGGTFSPGLDHETTSPERLLAVGVAMLGVLGAAVSFACLRALGKKTHPLMPVNYFSVISTVICTTILIAAPLLNIGQPFLRWIWPESIKQWGLMMSLGLIGFTMQYLLTKGLQADKSNRANSMIYTNMLYAAGFDKWLFGQDMGLMSFAGCVLILGSAVGVLFVKKSKTEKQGDVDMEANLLGQGESAQMLIGAGEILEDIHLERLR